MDMSDKLTKKEFIEILKSGDKEKIKEFFNNIVNDNNVDAFLQVCTKDGVKSVPLQEIIDNDELFDKFIEISLNSTVKEYDTGNRHDVNFFNDENIRTLLKKAENVGFDNLTDGEKATLNAIKEMNGHHNNAVENMFFYYQDILPAAMSFAFFGRQDEKRNIKENSLSVLSAISTALCSVKSLTEFDDDKYTFLNIQKFTKKYVSVSQSEDCITQVLGLLLKAMQIVSDNPTEFAKEFHFETLDSMVELDTDCVLKLQNYYKNTLEIVNSTIGAYDDDKDDDTNMNNDINDIINILNSVDVAEEKQETKSLRNRLKDE